MDNTIKIVCVGPSRSHKTAIVSFLTGMIDHLNYNPGSTIGVRILETEHQNIRIETWDVSGDQSYENTWTAIQKDTDGILLIYNADTMGHSKEIELWAEWFIQRPNISPSNCTCIGITTGTSPNPNFTLPGFVNTIPHEILTLDSPEMLRKVWEKLLTRIIKRRG